MFKPIHRYDQMNPAVHRFARVPRYGRLLSGLSANELSSITNEAQLFYTVYTKIEENPDAATGILHDGLRRPGFESFGWHNLNPAQGHMYSLWQIRLALDMLGAMAFEIMFGDTPPWNHRDQIRDSIDENVDRFIRRSWAKRFIDSKAYVDALGDPIPNLSILADWELLVKANRHVLKQFVFSRVEDASLRFNDISTQAFLAAYWATNYVRDEQERQRLWSCIPDDWREERQAYSEFWGFLADMPSSAYHQHQTLHSAQSCWEELLSPIFDQGHTSAPRDDNGKPIRASKLIYHAWDRMKDTAAGKVFRAEFAAILRGAQGKKKQQIARVMLEGFRLDLPLCEGKHGPTDNGEFIMGCSDEQAMASDVYRGVRDNPEHKVKLTRFWMHVFCVRNVEFELFEPRRVLRREFVIEVSNTELPDHPVVKVSWYDAACFAKWLCDLTLNDGQRLCVELATEAQWEYVCRAGERGKAFSWDGTLDDNLIELGYCNCDDQVPWRPGMDGFRVWGGRYLGRTIPVNGRTPSGEVVGRNRWGYFQFHGNVSEWCRDWYHSRTYYERVKFVVTEPVGPQWASTRVRRGGDWDCIGPDCRSARRGYALPSSRGNRIGFRLAAVPLRTADD